MPAYIARVSRLWPNASRGLGQTYVHVVNGFQRLGAVDSMAEWLAAHPESPWHDPGYKEYIVELDNEAEFNSLEANGVWWDGRQNLPKWQQQAGDTGSAKALGHYSEPTDDQSAWVADINLIDDRFQLKVHDDDIVANPAATHIGIEELDETPDTLITRYISLHDEAGVLVPRNKANDKTDVGGRNMVFDFGTAHSPPLSPGVTTFRVDLAKTANINFLSNHQYRFVGPDDGNPGYYQAQIAGNILRAEVG